MSDGESLPPALRALKAVCRCNNVKYRTIEKAIANGASSIRDIAIRTSATTGYCGGSCTPEILEMLDALSGRTALPARREMPAPPVLAEASGDEWWLRPKAPEGKG